MAKNKAIPWKKQATSPTLFIHILWVKSRLQEIIWLSVISKYVVQTTNVLGPYYV